MLLRRCAVMVGAGGCLGAAYRARDLPVAFHEAGHVILALHLAEDGMPCPHVYRKLQLHDTTPTLLKFVTIIPRMTDKGILYLGETKLTTRWRDMHEHAAWGATEHGEILKIPQLRASMLRPPDAPDRLLEAPPQVAINLARMCYLLAGRAAEDLLWQRSHPRLFSWYQPNTSEDSRDYYWSNDSAPQRVAALVASPGAASGDLRKAQVLAEADLMSHWVEAKSLIELTYDFTHAVINARWCQVQAVAGVLLACGTLDGAHLESLLQRLDKARDREDWMHSLLFCPLLFGGVWAACESSTRSEL